MTIAVAIVGTGLVGSAFIKQLGELIKKTPDLFKVVVIARSSKAIISEKFTGIPLENWEKELEKSEKSPLISNPTELVSFLSKSNDPVVLIDNTSNETLARSYPHFLLHGISIATPNKKAFSSELSLWSNLWLTSKQSGALLYHESTVGAGLPVISTINDLVATGDKIHKIEGIFSGTLSYIFNEFSSSSLVNNKVNVSPPKFSSIVTTARDLGYTEPDPREDLNGLDVARKLTILGRLAGLEIRSPSSFPVQSLIPAPLDVSSESKNSNDNDNENLNKNSQTIEKTSTKPLSIKEFLTKLPNYDGDIESVRAQAAKNGNVIRYVGKVDLDDTSGSSVSVGIEQYPTSHAFANLTGADNVIAIYTERYGDSPLIIQGAGAGAEVTAMGVLADLIKISQRKA